MTLCRRKYNITIIIINIIIIISNNLRIILLLDSKTTSTQIPHAVVLLLSGIEVNCVSHGASAQLALEMLVARPCCFINSCSFCWRRYNNNKATFPQMWNILMTWRTNKITHIISDIHAGSIWLQ